MTMSIIGCRVRWGHVLVWVTKETLMRVGRAAERLPIEVVNGEPGRPVIPLQPCGGFDAQAYRDAYFPHAPAAYIRIHLLGASAL
jgi:hypothetical protein